VPGKYEPAKRLIPKYRKKSLVCKAKCGVVVTIDITGSMGDAMLTLYDKAPVFYGQAEQQGYMPGDFAVSFAANGDAGVVRSGQIVGHRDGYPMQVADFAQGAKIDPWLKDFYLEGGGGGNRIESYDLLAYFYARHAEFTNPDRVDPFIFMIGDEGCYDYVYKEQVKEHIGDDLPSDIPIAEMFSELGEKYHVYHLHVPYRQGGSDDQRICEQWKGLVGEEHFILLDEPKSVVDTMLGIIALVGGTRDLEAYLKDLATRPEPQTAQRIANVKAQLAPVSAAVDSSKLPTAGAVKRGSGTRRMS